MYRVIKLFTDLQDNKHLYNIGDTYPREGVKASKKRINELASDKNRRGIPLIELVEAETKENAEENSVVETEE